MSDTVPPKDLTGAPGLSIAEAGCPEDYDAVAALCWAYREHLLTHDPDMRALSEAFYPEAEYAHLLGRLPEGHDTVLLARLGGQPVGCGMSVPLGGGACEIKRVFVDPAARGHGVAAALMKDLIARAREAGYGVIKLDTMRTLTAAQRLYARLGFRPCGPYTPVPETAVGRVMYFELPL